MGAKDNNKKEARKPGIDWKARMAPLIAPLRRIVRVLVPLALGTLLLAIGAFFAWQAWLVHTEETGAAEADTVRAAAIAAVGKELKEKLDRVQAALATPVVQDALAKGSAEGRQAASDALHAALPDLKDVDFYSPGLDEILAGDLAQFGYAKAQMLMQAQAHAAAAPMQMRFEKGKGQRLVMALPVKKDNAIVAFAMVYMPFDTMLRAFRTAHISGARLDLRQGDGRGDLVIASIGEGSGSSIGDLGEPIPGSMLRVGKGEPEYFIVGPRSFQTLVGLALLCLVGGIAALWLRRVGLHGAMTTLRLKAKPTGPELTLAEALRQEAAAPAKPAKSKPGEPSRPSRSSDAVEAPVNIDRSIFRAYDIRGVVGETLTPAVARGTRPCHRQRRPRPRYQGDRRRPRRAPLRTGHGLVAGRGPAQHRHGRDRHRCGADAGRLLRLLSPQHRLGRFRHRQPQSAGLQRLQDRPRRRNIVRRLDPGALRAHRRESLRQRQRQPADDGHHGRLYPPHRQRYPGRTQAQGRRRLRQRHSRRVRAAGHREHRLRGRAALLRRRRHVPEPPSGSFGPAQPAGPDPVGEADQRRHRPRVRRRRRSARRRHEDRRGDLPGSPADAVRDRHPDAQSGCDDHLRRQVHRASAAADPAARRQSADVAHRAIR